MRAREVILLALLLAGGILFTQIYTGKLDVSWGFDEFPFWHLKEFEFEEREIISPPLPPELELLNAHGEVEIEGTDDEQINIIFLKKFRRKNQEEAAAEAAGLRLFASKSEERLKLSSNRDEVRKKNLKTCFKIQVPSSMKIKVENSYGLVMVQNVRDTEISNPYGKTIVSDINGTLNLTNKYKNVEVTGVSSSCQIESHYSKVYLKDVAGETNISHSYGTLNLENLSAGLTLQGRHSVVEGFKLTGPNQIETTYKKIRLVEVGPTKLITHNSPVEIVQAEGEIFLENSYDRVSLKKIRGNLTVKGKYLRLSGADIRGDFLDISSSYREIELSRFSGQTKILLSHGDLILVPDSLTAPLEVNGDYVNISLTWPAGGRYPLEIHNKGGETNWLLKEKASFETLNNTTTLKAFSQEKTQPSISISTTYGTVTIREGDVPQRDTLSPEGNSLSLY
ncbi:MAG: hypothetical protein ACOC57_03600 [Acidobacteriota bacterium]